MGAGWTLGTTRQEKYGPDEASTWLEWIGSGNWNPSGLDTVSATVTVYESYSKARMLLYSPGMSGCRFVQAPKVGDEAVSKVCDVSVRPPYRNIILNSVVANVMLSVFISGIPQLQPEAGAPITQIMIARLPSQVVRPQGNALDQTTQEAVRAAILEYVRLEEQATARLDATLLEPRATNYWMSEKRLVYEDMKKRGLHPQSLFLDAQFKGFRSIGGGYVQLDVLEYWSFGGVDSTGKAIGDNSRQELPQTAVLVNDGGRWKVADARFYTPGAAPF